jgi:hypothetical protein
MTSLQLDARNGPFLESTEGPPSRDRGAETWLVWKLLLCRLTSHCTKLILTLHLLILTLHLLRSIPHRESRLHAPGCFGERSAMDIRNSCPEK